MSLLGNTQTIFGPDWVEAGERGLGHQEVTETSLVESLKQAVVGGERGREQLWPSRHETAAAKQSRWGVRFVNLK